MRQLTHSEKNKLAEALSLQELYTAKADVYLKRLARKYQVVGALGVSSDRYFFLKDNSILHDEDKKITHEELAELNLVMEDFHWAMAEVRLLGAELKKACQVPFDAKLNDMLIWCDKDQNPIVVTPSPRTAGIEFNE